VLSAHVGGKIRVVSQMPIDTFADLGRVYTPGVGEVCRRIHEDASMADRYTIIANTCAIVSDGSAVLGLGNLGPLAAMPVLEGKAALLAHLVGVNAVPIALRSQDPEDIIEATAAISASFGVIQLEDIASPKCAVRVIITVQKLREGWDCPFAYVLCSLRETRSATAIEQIVGRILRLPRARAKHPG